MRLLANTLWCYTKHLDLMNLMANIYVTSLYKTFWELTRFLANTLCPCRKLLIIHYAPIQSCTDLMRLCMDLLRTLKLKSGSTCGALFSPQINLGLFFHGCFHSTGPADFCWLPSRYDTSIILHAWGRGWCKRSSIRREVVWIWRHITLGQLTHCSRQQSHQLWCKLILLRLFDWWSIPIL